VKLLRPLSGIRIIFTVLLTAALSIARPAHADEARQVTGLGFARLIPRSYSASRDAPAFGVAMAPRGIRTAATELAIVSVPIGPVTVRPGFYGLIELEGNADAAFTLWPSQEIHFWRGSYAAPLAVSFDEWGPALCTGCALEASLQFRHESEHFTGNNQGGQPADYSDRPIYGDAVGIDFGFATDANPVFLLARPALDFFLPERSSYSLGPSFDVHLRYTVWDTVQPFFSGFAHYRFGTTAQGYEYPDAHLLRALTGVALPSSLGAILLFVSGDVGHRTGLAAYTREASLGAGVRLALGALPEVNE
jgi:hypothetical protein